MRTSSIGRISRSRTNLSILLCIAKRFCKYVNTYSIMRTIKNNIQDTGIRLRKEFIQLMKGGSPVDRVHYNVAERLFILGEGTNRSEEPSQTLCLNRALKDE